MEFGSVHLNRRFRSPFLSQVDLTALKNLDLKELADCAEEASSFLRALGNSHRLMILCVLARGEASVGEIQEALALRQSLVSQHLTRLKADELVIARRSQQFMLYSIKTDAVREVIATVCKHFVDDKESWD